MKKTKKRSSKLLSALMTILMTMVCGNAYAAPDLSDLVIDFADANVKALCVANWDTDGDGELNRGEAEAVTSLGYVFMSKTTITSFDELRYFTGLTSIGNYVFSGCSGLTSVTIPSTVTSIGNGAFGSCTGLTSITIPRYVTSINLTAFANCSGLTSITVEQGNTYYDSRDNCNAIIESTNNRLIAGCKTTIIPNTVTYISGSAFYGCSGLTSVTIPNSVTGINEGAFDDCLGLTSIIVEGGNTKYDSRDNCNAIIESASNKLIAGCKNTVVPNSVTSIGNRAFFGHSGLTSVTIPNSVTSIGGSAFNGCSGLTSVTIPNSVTSIGSNAFYGCSGLTRIKCF